jgi:hypothetical protein
MIGSAPHTTPLSGSDWLHSGLAMVFADVCPTAIVWPTIVTAQRLHAVIMAVQWILPSTVMMTALEELLRLLMPLAVRLPRTCACACGSCPAHYALCTGW